MEIPDEAADKELCTVGSIVNYIQNNCGSC